MKLSQMRHAAPLWYPDGPSAKAVIGSSPHVSERYCQTQIKGVLPCPAGHAVMQGRGRGKKSTWAMLLLSLQRRWCRSALQAVLSCKAKGAAEVEAHTTDLTSASAIDQLANTLLQRHKVCRQLLSGSCGSCHGKQFPPAAPTRCVRSF